MIQIKRVYEEPAKSDGKRFLVDRLWPRGVKKEDLAMTRWIKEIAPSNELRHWFNHEPEKWSEFQKRYRAELKRHPEILKSLRTEAKDSNITLLFSARDEAHNNAVVLRDCLTSRTKS